MRGRMGRMEGGRETRRMAGGGWMVEVGTDVEGRFYLT